MLKIKLMYKIHALNTANGMCRSAGNDTFYETEEEALEMARSYVKRGSSDVSMVIYKAHVLVRPTQAPIEIMSIEHDGSTTRLSSTIMDEMVKNMTERF